MNTLLIVLWLVAGWGILHSLKRISKQLHYALKALERIEARLTPPGASSVDFYASVGGIITKVDHMNLKISQKLPLSIAITDKFGNPAKVDGLPVWSLTAPELGNLVVGDDGMSATLTPTGKVGSFSVQVNADADLGEGVKTILGELPIELVGGDAAIIAISAGEPVDA